MIRRSLCMTVIVTLATCTWAEAGIILTATYTEDAAAQNYGNPNDIAPDTFEFTLTDGLGGTAGFDITGLTIALPSGGDGVYVDTLSGGSGHSAAFGFLDFSTGATAASTVVDGATAIPVTATGFGDSLLDVLKFSIDLDDSNWAVRGFYPGSAYGAIGGNSTAGSPGDLTLSALLTVDYTHNGLAGSVSGHFYGINPDTGQAFANVMLLNAPEPAALAVWSLLGFAGAGFITWRRRRK